MALNEKEQQLYDKFLELDIINPDYIDHFVNFCHNVYDRDYENRTPIKELCKKVKNECMSVIMTRGYEDNEDYIRRVHECNEAMWAIIKMEAQHRQFDSYCMYLEKKRNPKEKFYQPRRKVLRQHGVIQAFQQLIDDELDVLTISMPPGSGKGQIDSSKILTPTGFKTFADIELGMEVIAGNGKIAHVIGIFPQGKRKCYRFTMNDGSSTIVSDNHLWEVMTRDDRARTKKTRVVETSKMLSNVYVEGGRRKNYSIEYIPKIDLIGEELLLHPYVIGYLLGNGNLSGSSVKVTTCDLDVLERINNLLPGDFRFEHIDGTKYDYTLKVYYGLGRNSHNYVRESLLKYDMLKKHSYEKHIPKDYLNSSYENRLELLRGLMDSDGTANKLNAGFTSTSEQFANDVRELVHSLGGYCSIAKKTNCGYKDKDGNFIKCRDSYNLHIRFSVEKDNPFWVKRKHDKYQEKKCIVRFIENIEYVGEYECKCILIDDPCHLYITDDYIITHNTTIEKFFHSAVAGWFPKDYSLFYSHSGDITRMYYDGVYDIVTNDEEYNWHEIFPDLKVTNTNAKLEQFNVGKYKPFQSIQCTSLGAKNSGKVRVSPRGFLFVDDMIGSIEEALNKNTLDKLWNAYSVDARQRKMAGGKELHIATRWSVHDVIGRLQQAYEDSDRAKFISIPAIDTKTGKSNFMYDREGFSVEFFKDQELLMDDISFRCLYMQDPVEREGLLYDEDDLRRFIDLPTKEPDAILGVCDTKTTGIDYMFLPVFYKYDNDYYLADCICDDSADFNVQYGRCTDIIIKHKMQQVEFESNAGGSRIAFEVQDRVKKQGGICNITTHPTETNKETRIIVNSDWIKQNVLFKNKTEYSPKSDYGRMMAFLLGYSVAGKNKHDDVPDGLANFALFVSRKLNRRVAMFTPSPI